mgnify:CR=1 FL=1
MGICPLSNEPCNNLKSECVFENINKEKTELNLCKQCSTDYLNSSYFKDEYLEFFEKNKLLQQENEQIEIQQIKPTSESNVISNVKSFFKSIFEKKNKPVNEPMNLEKMKNLFYRVKNDMQNDFENKKIHEAGKKQDILNQIRIDIKVIKKIQQRLIEVSNEGDLQSVNLLKENINQILLKYEELYNALFN